MRIALLADVHSQAGRLQLALDRIAAAGIKERLLLGDVVGFGSDPVGAVRLARELELVLAGNHDVWLLPGRGSDLERRLLQGRDMVWLASLPTVAQRRGLLCCHGTPSEPLLGFFDRQAAERELGDLTPGSLLVVGHTHVPLAWVRAGERIFQISAEPGKTIYLDPDWVVCANPGPVASDPDIEGGPWWLEVDPTQRSLRWHSG